MTPEQIAADLDSARGMARAGLPIFLANPATDAEGDWRPDGGSGGCGYWFPAGWEQTVADPAVLDRWRPGMAVCAVMGHGLDALDVDPRNGGDVTRDGMVSAGLWPRVYAEAATPSGGTHELVAALNVASRDGLRDGLDVKAGLLDAGNGRGFVFIAPTVKLSKETGEVAPYRWTRRPDLALWAEERDTDDTGQAVAAMIHDARTSGRGDQGEPETYTGAPFADLPEHERARIEAWTRAAVNGVCEDLRASAPWPAGSRDRYHRGWERFQADAAFRLGKLARASWCPLTIAQAAAAFTAAAPTDAGWTREDVAEKWRTQSTRKSPAPFPEKLGTEAAYLSSLPPISTLSEIRQSTPGVSPDPAAPSVPPTDKKSVATQLVDLADTRWHFGISTEGEAFALPHTGPQVVRMLTGSRSIRAELADLFQETTGKVAGQQALADAVLVS